MWTLEQENAQMLWFILTFLIKIKCQTHKTTLLPLQALAHGGTTCSLVKITQFSGNAVPFLCLFECAKRHVCCYKYLSVPLRSVGLILVQVLQFIWLDIKRNSVLNNFRKIHAMSQHTTTPTSDIIGKKCFSSLIFGCLKCTCLTTMLLTKIGKITDRAP